MIDEKEIEEAFFNEVDLCLGDHENFQHGLEDARTAFNETFEYHEPFDIAELLFNKGANWRDKKVQESENWSHEMITKYNDLHFKLSVAKEALQKVVEYDASYVNQEKGKLEMRLKAQEALKKIGGKVAVKDE